MIYYSNGGFSHSDVYDMPIYLRNFYVQKLVEIKKTEQKEAEKAMNKAKSSGPSRPSIPRR